MGRVSNGISDGLIVRWNAKGCAGRRDLAGSLGDGIWDLSSQRGEGEVEKGRGSRSSRKIGRGGGLNSGGQQVNFSGFAQ